MVRRQLRNFPVYEEQSHENFKAVKPVFSAVIQTTNRQVSPLEKHILKPQEDKVKLVLWETGSDEAGSVNVAAVTDLLLYVSL